MDGCETEATWSPGQHGRVATPHGEDTEIHASGKGAEVTRWKEEQGVEFSAEQFWIVVTLRDHVTRRHDVQ